MVVVAGVLCVLQGCFMCCRGTLCVGMLSSRIFHTQQANFSYLNLSAKFCSIPPRLPFLGGLLDPLLRPVAQLYGQVRTDWNQCFVMDCSLSFPAGHKPFTCSHSVLRNTWLNIHAVRWMRFSSRLSVHVFTISQNLTCSLFVSSAVCELSSAWSINCFLRYVCCCFVVKDKSLSVLMVDRCCGFASLKPVQSSRQ